MTRLADRRVFLSHATHDTRPRRPAPIVALTLCVMLAGCADEAVPPSAPSGPTTPAPPSGQALLARLTADDGYPRETALAIAATGDEALRRAASPRLVAVAQMVTALSWRTTARALIQRAHARTGPAPSPEQLEAQVDRARDEQLVKVLAAMDVVGGPDVVSYCFELAENDLAPTRVRQAALAVLARQIDARDTASRARGAALWARVTAPSAPIAPSAPAAPSGPVAPSALVAPR